MSFSKSKASKRHFSTSMCELGRTNSILKSTGNNPMEAFLGYNNLIYRSASLEALYALL